MDKRIGCTLALLAVGFLCVWPRAANAQVEVVEARTIFVEPPDQLIEIAAGLHTYAGGLSGETRPGGTVGVRAVFNTHSRLAAEAAFTGAANPIAPDALPPGVDSAWLFRNGIEGLIRLNLATASMVQPFAAAGLGLARFDASDTALSGLEDRLVGVAPVAAGAQVYLTRDMAAGVRGEYRFGFDEDFAGVDGPIQSVDLYASLGMRF